MRSMKELEELFDDEYTLSLLANYFSKYPDVLFFAECSKGPWDKMNTLEIIAFGEYLKKYYTLEI